MQGRRCIQWHSVEPEYIAKIYSGHILINDIHITKRHILINDPKHNAIWSGNVATNTAAQTTIACCGNGLPAKVRNIKVGQSTKRQNKIDNEERAGYYRRSGNKILPKQTRKATIRIENVVVQEDTACV